MSHSSTPATDADGAVEADVVTPATLGQRIAAEAFGTFALVLIGCGSIAIGLANGGDFAVVPLAFGLAYAVLGYAFGRLSGGHFNPAVSIGAALAGRQTWKDAGAYAGAQIVGGILAAVVLLVLMLGFDSYEAFDGGLGASGWGDASTGYAWWAALLLEIVMTAVFVLVHLGSYDRRNATRGFAPLATGLALTAIYAATLAATLGGTNPARSLGVALFDGTDALAQVWVFIVAPLLGALLAGLAYPALFGRDGDAVPGSGLSFSSGSKSAGATAGYDQSWQQGGVGGQGGYGGYQQGGYGQPQQGGYGAPQQAGYGQSQQSQQYGGAGQAAQAQPEQPIIQDGWQWDPQAQQWIPAQQGGGDEGRTQIR